MSDVQVCRCRCRVQQCSKCMCACAQAWAWAAQWTVDGRWLLLRLLWPAQRRVRSVRACDCGVRRRRPRAAAAACLRLRLRLALCTMRACACALCACACAFVCLTFGKQTANCLAEAEGGEMLSSNIHRRRVCRVSCAYVVRRTCVVCRVPCLSRESSCVFRDFICVPCGSL